MAKGYEAPHEVRELEKLINNFTYANGLEVTGVFRDFLRYIIHGFSLPDTPPLTDWRYTKEQNKAFAEMLITWFNIMDAQIKIHGWYDAFGDLCDALTMGNDSGIHSIYDTAAGSGRMLLSAKAKHPRNYLVAWDIDYTCCLMCVCNFLINSCVGEVVCIDTLRMDNFRGAWIVNEAYYRTELPSVRWLNEQEYLQYKQAEIPAYVYFLDREHYDSYINMCEMWTVISSLMHDDTPTEALNKAPIETPA